MKTVILAAIAAVALGLALGAEAQRETKQCINLETGRIITVAAGTPCPFPMAEY